MVLQTKTDTSDMGIALGAKQPSITTSTNLNQSSIKYHQVFTRYYYSPTGYTDIQLKASEVYLGSPSVIMAAALEALDRWSLVFVDQGLKVRNVFILQLAFIFRQILMYGLRQQPETNPEL